MRFNFIIISLAILVTVPISLASQTHTSGSEAYLSWSAAQAEKIGKSTRENGKAGSFVDLRIISTDRAINYKLRATLMTPEVIRASARTLQLRNRLTDDQTRKLVADGDAAGDLVVMVEIDPNEGSGVIPLDWRVFLQPKGAKPDSDAAITGIKSQNLRKVQALSGLYRRDYDYDVFWVSFPLVDDKKKPLLPLDIGEIQLIVGIYRKEGQISWRMPESVREKMKELSKQ
jgi:hypothetical protein